MTFFTCPDEAYLKEGSVRMWLSLVFLCPRDKELGVYLFTPVRPLVRSDMDTWFVRISPLTVLELLL